MGKALVNITIFPISFGGGRSKRHVVFMLSKIDVRLFDVT